MASDSGPGAHEDDEGWEESDEADEDHAEAFEIEESLYKFLWAGGLFEDFLNGHHCHGFDSIIPCLLTILLTAHWFFLKRYVSILKKSEKTTKSEPSSPRSANDANDEPVNVLDESISTIRIDPSN